MQGVVFVVHHIWRKAADNWFRWWAVA